MSSDNPKYDEDFKQGAVQLVTQAGKPIVQVAREPGGSEGTLGNGCAKARGAAAARRTGERSKSEWPSGPGCGRRIVELRMQRDVLKRLVVLWMDEAMGR